MEPLFILKGGDRDETNYGLYCYWNCCDWRLFWTFKASSTDHKASGRNFNDDASSSIRSDSKGVVAGLAEEGYRNGKNIKIEYQNANGDQGNLNTMANKLVNDHAKVVVGITTPACQALANATKDIPIVMGELVIRLVPA